MFVSILMAVHNEADYLTECLESLRRQTHADWELVVVDDASSDATSRILREFGDPRMRVLRNETNLGVTASLNRGLRECRGELVARMDGDDIASPLRLETQVAAFRRAEDLVLLGSRVVFIDDGSIPIGFESTRFGDATVRSEIRRLNGVALVHPTIMFRRNAALEIDGYDEDFRTAQDLDFYLRMTELGRVDNVDEVLLAWRQHPESTNSTQHHLWRERRRQILAKAKERGADLDYGGLAAAIEVQKFNFPPAAYRCASKSMDCGKFANARRHIATYRREIGVDRSFFRLIAKYLVRRCGIGVNELSLPDAMLSVLK